MQATLVALTLAACEGGSGTGGVDESSGNEGTGSTGDTGAVDPTSTGSVPPSERKRVFYFRNGTLGKIRDSADTRPALAVADEDCTVGAEQMGWPGAWRAWLSSSESDAIDRILDVGPWYRTDQETLLFASKAELTMGPRAPIDPTLDDPARDDDLLFWTGTDLDGRRTADNCTDWTVYNVPAIATVGRADISGPAWVAAEPLQCSNYLALLCIEQ
jgi:hypothetical protein